MFQVQTALPLDEEFPHEEDVELQDKDEPDLPPDVEFPPPEDVEFQ